MRAGQLSSVTHCGPRIILNAQGPASPVTGRRLARPPGEPRPGRTKVTRRPPRERKPAFQGVNGALAQAALPGASLPSPLYLIQGF